MDSWIIAVIEDCTAASDAGTKAFPSVIADLIGAGVERYHADLVRAQKVYYLPSGESRAVGCHALDAQPAMTFVATGVEAAVRDAQAGRIDYRSFCRRIAEAGCTGYHVSIPGRRAVYYGRTAEMHVEVFPD